MKKTETLLKLLKLSEYIKLSAKKNYGNLHHPLKNELSKSHRRILLTLENGDLNQRTISKRLMLSPQAISEAVKKLEFEGYVTKDTNKKETIIKLTQKGHQEAGNFIEIINNHAEEFLKNFSDDELDSVIKFANKLMEDELCLN